MNLTLFNRAIANAGPMNEVQRRAMWAKRSSPGTARAVAAPSLTVPASRIAPGAPTAGQSPIIGWDPRGNPIYDPRTPHIPEDPRYRPIGPGDTPAQPGLPAQPAPGQPPAAQGPGVPPYARAPERPASVTVEPLPPTPRAVNMTPVGLAPGRRARTTAPLPDIGTNENPRIQKALEGLQRALARGQARLQ